MSLIFSELTVDHSLSRLGPTSQPVRWTFSGELEQVWTRRPILKSPTTDIALMSNKIQIARVNVYRLNSYVISADTSKY